MISSYLNSSIVIYINDITYGGMAKTSLFDIVHFAYKVAILGTLALELPEVFQANRKIVVSTSDLPEGSA